MEPATLFLVRTPGGEVVPKRLRRRITAAVMSNFIKMNVLECFQVGILVQVKRIFPVLDLSITRKQQLLPANFQKKYYAGVVHRLIQNADQAQHLIATQRPQLPDEPAVVRGEEVLKDIGIWKESHIAGREVSNQLRCRSLQTPELLSSALQHPELIFVSGALVLYLCILV